MLRFAHDIDQIAPWPEPAGAAVSIATAQLMDGAESRGDSNEGRERRCANVTGPTVNSMCRQSVKVKV
jgi:hypothetical protein